MSVPAFSYAQAAKGLAPSPQASSNVTSSASSEHGTKESVSSETTSTPSRAKQLPSQHDNEQEATTTITETVKETSQTSREPDPENLMPLAKNISRSPQQSQVSSRKVSGSDLERTIEVQTDIANESSETSNHVPSSIDNALENTNQASELDKSKDNDEDWEKVSIPSITTEKELRAAPIPTVNIWQQRREAQEAKLKETIVQRPAVVANTTSKPKLQQQTGPEESKRKQNAKEQSNTDSGSGTSRRVNSGARTGRDQGSSQSLPRTISQKGEKSSSIPPSVGDVESWPTPETAISDDRRRSTTTEKNEKPESNESRASGQKNKWTPIPFVPSVKFETQLPPAAQSRRGGRPSNRGRSAISSQGERASDKVEPGTMGPPPLPKQSAEQDRGRKNNGGRPNRASSVPTDSPRTASVEDSARKFSVTPGKDQTPTTSSREVPIPSIPMISGHTAETSITDNLSRSPSRKANRHQPGSRKPDRDTDEDLGLSTDPSGLSESQEGLARSQIQVDRPKGESQENYRASNEHQRERGQNQSRDWNRDRTSSSREKGDSWRDRREPRPDRGRGAFRGRGGHATFSSNNSNNGSSSSHPYTSPLPQNGFDSPKATPSAEPRSRQASQPFGPSPSFSANRSNPRSQSIPVSMIHSGYYPPVQGFQQAISPIQTEMNYGPYGQMHSGILSAMPYQDQLGSFALMSMVVTQLEYYFSLDNLCKDLFLRKNMDSQGFVPLRVIADFRRIKALLGDGQIGFDQLRGVCQQARNIELAIGEDNETLLRSKENWKDFVLPMEERLSSAQNDGPSVRAQQQPSIMAPEFAPGAVPMRSPPPQLNGMHDAYSQQMAPVSFMPVAGYDGQTSESFVLRAEPSSIDQERRSSTTSPLSKIASPSNEYGRTFSGSLANGHHSSISIASDKESTFPDESVAVLKVVVRDPDYQGELASEATEQHSGARVSGLRGGSGNPEQLERIRALQFGQSVPQSRNLSEQTVYWTQGEGSIRPGYVHEEYLSLRDKAQSQRAEKHFDGALLVLYPLWADFLSLPHQFNVSMYEDFKDWALEDYENGNENGKKHLVRFYDAMLTNKTPMTERIATDIVNIARQEASDNRSMWHKLRAAWRNGATNLKTRKRLTDLLSIEEQTELDRGM